MQPVQLEKLKTLLKTSPVLNAQERSDWLALLELMNDKQLAELEKILTENTATGAQNTERKLATNVPIATAATNQEQQEVKDRTGFLQEKPKPQPYKPTFKHLMNFPSSAHMPIAKPVAQPSPGAEQLGQTSAFNAKLKAVLAEKELPQGHPNPQDELELPAPKIPEAPVPKPAPTGTGQVALKDVVKVQKPPVVQPPQAKPGPLATKPGANYDSPSLKEKRVQEAAVKPAATSSMPKADTADTSAKLAQVLAGKPVSSLMYPQGSKKAESGELGDLSVLSITALKQQGLAGLEKKLKALVNKQGYHKVISDLEKSPIYQAYINTGSKLLNSGSTFEQMAQKPSEELLAERLLSKEEFEGFVDVLRQIQAG